MTTLETLVQTPFARAIGWTLFHSLWEGTMVAMVLLACLFVFRSPRVRYVCACLAMFGVLSGFAFTLYGLMPERVETVTKIHHAIPRPPLGEREILPSMPAQFHASDALPWLAPFWIAGVILFHLRSFASWVAARRLSRRGVCVAPDPWQQRLLQLRTKLRVSKSVTLLETCLADVPVVIGYLRPVILVPISILAAMPASQIDAILLHELAHVLRRDYLANLLQTVVEGFLFYHPAVWWISSVIRTERENCCDDIVVAASGNVHEYTAALAALEQARWDAGQAALAVTGGSLVKRIRRLLYRPEASRTALAPFFSVSLLVIVAAGGLTAWQANAPIPATSITKPRLVSQAQQPGVASQLTGQPSDPKPAVVTGSAPAFEDVIESIEFRGVHRIPQDTLRALISSKKGDKLDEESIYKDFMAMWNTGRFDDIRVEREAGKTGWILRFLMIEHPAGVPRAAMPAIKPQIKLVAQVRPSSYAKWLNEEVLYIIEDQERAAFQRLQTDEERDHFIYQFWLRRDPTPGTPENEYRVEHYRRIAYANDHYTSRSGVPGWKTDRGRIYITLGPPDEIDAHSSGQPFPFENWRYHHVDGIGNDVDVQFVDKAFTGEFPVTKDPTQKNTAFPSPNSDLEMPTIRLGQQGRLYLNDQPVNINLLATEIKRRFPAVSEVYLTPDKDTPWDAVLQVLAQLRAAKPPIPVRFVELENLK